MTETQTFALVGEPPVQLEPVETKALVRHRDGYRCTDCGMTASEHFLRTGRNLDVHRLVPGSPYTIAGCVTLCRRCHRLKPKLPRLTGSESRGFVGLTLNAELVRLFRSLAAKNRRTLTAELSIAMEQHLKENGIVPPSPPEH
jgi:hypothetical protein